MTSRWLWWAPLYLLVIGTGLIALRWGWVAATVKETDVINHYAARYVAKRGAGAALTDCAAFPGTSHRIWLVIRCLPADPDVGKGYKYYVNRLGGFEYGETMSPYELERPQT